MTKTKKDKTSEQNHWEMESSISREVSFRTSLRDGYHGIVISRFPSEIKLAEFNAPPYRERTFPIGLTQVSHGLDTLLMIVPRKGIVVADSRLALDYCDDGSCGPEYIVEGYLSDGNLICVSGPSEGMKPYLAKLREGMIHDDDQRLKRVFGGLLQDRLTQTVLAFERIQGLIRNSDLPSHYKHAVRGIL